MSPRKTAFSAHADDRTRVLICGSLPGERSLAEGRYYAHPSNQFWKLTGAVLGCDLASLDYDRRIGRLLTAGIGLWDAVGSATRIGSGDAAIRDHRPNRLAKLAQGLPRLQAIAFNGGTAAKIGRGQVGTAHAALVDLPSSSAAYAAMPLAEKRAQWLALRDFLDHCLPANDKLPMVEP